MRARLRRVSTLSAGTAAGALRPSLPCGPRVRNLKNAILKFDPKVARCGAEHQNSWCPKRRLGAPGVSARLCRSAVRRAGAWLADGAFHAPAHRAHREERSGRPRFYQRGPARGDWRRAVHFHGAPQWMLFDGIERVFCALPAGQPDRRPWRCARGMGRSREVPAVDHRADARARIGARSLSAITPKTPCVLG